MEQALVTNEQKQLWRFETLFKQEFQKTFEVGAALMEKPHSIEGSLCKNKYHVSKMTETGILSVEETVVEFELPTLVNTFLVDEASLDILVSDNETFSRLVAPLVVKAIGAIYMELECKNRNNTNLIGTDFLTWDIKRAADSPHIEVRFVTRATKTLSVLAALPEAYKRAYHVDKLQG